MIRFKDGVMLRRKFGVDGLTRVQPETFHALNVVADIFRDKNLSLLTVTSLLDGTHMKGSLHYKGLAVDIRLPFATDSYINARELNCSLLEKIKSCLGESYDCILEDDHIHIEFDPKYN